MVKQLVIIIFFGLLSNKLFATHNRAGEITYKHINGYTFEFTITTYTYRFSPANRKELTVYWGDGYASIVPITSAGNVIIPNTDYYKNVYIAQHSFPGAGIYEILMEDPNRNDGVKNIPNSVNTVFSIKTTMLVGSYIGTNSTPVLLNPPIDKAAKGHIFIHNPAAYDPDGDSLSYAITTCTGTNGQPISGYVLPASTDTLLIDEVIGDLQWKTPAETGVYNIAILVEEWRKGIKIGKIARDMQIDVYETMNRPPVTSPIPDICVIAGDSIFFSISATDADNDPMTQFMTGGGLIIPKPAVFTIDSAASGWVVSHFTWATHCDHARKQPYTFVLHTEDINDDINLTDINSFLVRILHRAPENLKLLPGTDSIRLQWDVSSCGVPDGYNIYRRIDPYIYLPDSCTTGLPEYTGYKMIGVVKGKNTNFYKDDDSQAGLVPGYDYCYRVTAWYSDGAESLPSAEACTTLISGVPPLLKVSVEADDAVNGRIDLAWAVPIGADTLHPGPWRYTVKRKAPGESTFTIIQNIDSPDLKDTTYTDTGINTLIFPYTYTVELSYKDGSIYTVIPGSENATSQYIDYRALDNEMQLTMKKKSPWLVDSYSVYRKAGSQLNYDSIGFTINSAYADTGLINGQEYFYRTVGNGHRPLYGKDFFVTNRSHIISGIPIDTLPPCPPDLTVTSECDSATAFNFLTWTSFSDSCSRNEILYYKLYSKNTLEGVFDVLDSLPYGISEYKDYAEGSIEKCYALTAIDSAGNESDKISNCVYNLCGLYELPNVFTPNNDEIHELYVSYNLNNYVKQVNMTIFNRNGKEVFKTNDPAINWNGRITDSNKLVSTGVYYYVCDVFEPRISGTILNTLTGFIHVYSKE